MDFISRHTLDRFFLVDNQRVSVRSWIARELVSNILVHREFSRGYIARIIIEKDRIIAENWNRPTRPGQLTLEGFKPDPKNPLLAHFFIQIGRADILGSGVRNLYKYTQIYSGGEPQLIEDDVFTTVIPLKYETDENIAEVKLTQTSDKPSMSDNASDKMSDNRHKQLILSYIETHGEINTTIAASLIDRSPGTARRILSRLNDENYIVAIGANRNRKYKLTNH